MLGHVVGSEARPSYLFRVWRPPYDPESAERLGDGIMDTLKLEEVVQGKRTSDSPYMYSSQQGRQVSDSDARARIDLARRKSSPMKGSKGHSPGAAERIQSWAASDTSDPR